MRLCICGKSTAPFACYCSFIIFPHSLSSGSMSVSSSNSNVPSSQFQDLFDAALSEYRQKTGNDIATDPLITSLQNCNSSDAVLGILQEQAHAFNQFRNGDWQVQLMRRLKPTVDILLRLSTSGVFGQGIGSGLVRLIPIHISFVKVYHPPCRNFPPHKRYLPVLVSYSQYVSIYLFACACSLDAQILLRPRRELAPVMMHLLTFLNASNITLAVSKYSARSPLQWEKYWSK